MPDQQSTSDPNAAAAPSPLRSRLLAAWDAGRLLNEAFFHLRQAVLLPLPLCREHQQAFEQRLEKLALLIRETVETTMRQDELRDGIRKELNAWRAELDSEQFPEDWRPIFQELGETLKGSYQGTLHEMRRAACDNLLRGVEASLARLRQGIENSLDERRLQAFRLGEFLDQGLRPADVIGEMYASAASDSQATPADNQGSAEVEISFGSEGTKTTDESDPVESEQPWATEEPDPLEYCPSKSLWRTAIAPGDEWHAEFRQRWQQLGLPLSGLPAGTGEKGVEAFESMIEAANRAARQTLSQEAQAASGSEIASDAAPANDSGGLKPVWDSQKQILTLGDYVLKDLKRQSPTHGQLRLLGAFQDAGWPQTIPNPFKGGDGNPDAAMLRQTVNNFNRTQDNKCKKEPEARWLRFSTAGGSSVSWGFIGDAAN